MRTFIRIATAMLALPLAAGAQPLTLGPAQQRAIIDKAAELVAANYVFPDKAKLVAQTLAANAVAGKYAALSKLDDFLAAVNADMQDGGGDRHLRIVANPRIVAQLRKEAAGGGVAPEYVAMLRAENFRLRKVETLDGNVGYFKFDNFVEPELSKTAFTGAMDFLHHTSAVVIDLTDNGGGSSEAADYLLSYFLKEGTTIGTSWNRQTSKTTTSTVVRARDVRTMLDTPLFLVVSERTASAAEGVAYALQALKRAVVVGTRTRGMANPGVRLPIDDRLFIVVPTITSKNAITGTNWEGVGVTPDIAIAADKAVPRAVAEALNALAERSTNKNDQARLRFFAAGFEAMSAPQAPPPGFVNLCVGEYEEGRRIVMTDGVLYFVSGAVDRRLTYMGDRTFMVDGRADYRVKFQVEQDAVTQFQVLWFDDTADTYKRTK